MRFEFLNAATASGLSSPCVSEMRPTMMRAADFPVRLLVIRGAYTPTPDRLVLRVTSIPTLGNPRQDTPRSPAPARTPQTQTDRAHPGMPRGRRGRSGTGG